MKDWRYTKGLHDIGNGCWAYLLPDGGWGWSNSGLIVDGENSLLVDTLFDVKMTSEMLNDMRDATKASETIDVLVNTHADGDHTFGNQAVKGAKIVASKATASEFFKTTPAMIHAMVTDPGSYGEGGQYIAEWMGAERFDFRDIKLVPPTETFLSEMALKIGDKDVNLINVGPAHTAGDTLVHVVQDRVLYTGDILFMGVHPAIWEGSIEGWIAACDRMLAMDVDVIVPGHGPITDKSGVRLFKQYLELLRDETRKRFDAGIGVEEAALDIVLSQEFSDWISPERIVGSVNFLYREYGSVEATTDFMEIFAMISRYAKNKPKQEQDACSCGHGH